MSMIGYTDFSKKSNDDTDNYIFVKVTAIMILRTAFRYLILNKRVFCFFFQQICDRDKLPVVHCLQRVSVANTFNLKAL